jgi:DAK2 domain fusion protein YloV
MTPMTTNQMKTSESVTETYPQIYSITGQELKMLVEAALIWLKTNQQLVNSLNVFPVPDGDTGTNMLLTMQAAYNEIINSSETNIGKMAKDIAQGALMGARGNSGVILSQIWRGFARALDSFPEMDARLLARALSESRNTAYKGVVRPVEGTILTVIKDVATAIENSVTKTTNLSQLLADAVSAADASVRYTPELLPILKTAGVVDSGGKGLFFLLEGMQRMLNKESLDTSAVTLQSISTMNLKETMDAVEEGQDVEVVIDFEPKGQFDLNSFYNDLSNIGTSIQVGEGDGLYRMHIHVEAAKRNEPLEYVSKIGTWSKVAMENLQLQMENSDAKDSGYTLNEFKPGSIAVITISPGLGLSKIFASLGVAAIVEGGQTMNPSTEEILNAFENLPTDQVIILPNNKNIILAAENAKNLSVKNVRVVPSVNIPQGLSALLRLDPDGNLDEINDEMVAALSDVDAGEITIATRTVEIDDVEVAAGQYIGLLNGKLVVSADSADQVVLSLLSKAGMDEKERVTLFTGINISPDQVEKTCEEIQEKYPKHEVEVHEGGQPHYHFLISLE